MVIMYVAILLIQLFCTLVLASLDGGPVGLRLVITDSLVFKCLVSDNGWRLC